MSIMSGPVALRHKQAGMTQFLENPGYYLIGESGWAFVCRIV